MSSSFRKAFLVPWKPEVQFLRHRNKINIQRPALPHYERAKVLKICQPTFVKPKTFSRPTVELCEKPLESIKKKEEEENPYANILAKELYKRTTESQFIGFLHKNPTSTEENFKINVALHKADAKLKVYGRTLVEKAFLNTYYEPVLCLFTSHSAIVFGSDGSPKTVASILKILRRSPTLLLLAGIIDKRMLNRNELETYSKLTDLTTARAQLVALLHSAGGGRLVQDLTFHQQTLTQQLDQHIQQAGGSVNSKKECATETPAESK